MDILFASDVFDRHRIAFHDYDAEARLDGYGHVEVVAGSMMGPFQRDTGLHRVLMLTRRTLL